MEFEYKLYDKSWEFKDQIKPTMIYSNISFQEELNWWQWNLEIEVEWNLEDYQTSDIVEIRNTEVGNMYTWIIEEIWVIEYRDSDVLKLKILWIFSGLNDIEYKSWWSRSFTKTWTVWSIIKDIIDSFNNDYGPLFWDTQILQINLIRYTWSSIDDTWDDVNIEFEKSSCLDAIKKTIKETWFDFYIWKDWIAYVTQKVNQLVKNVTFEREIISIQRTITKKNMVNKYYLTRDSWVEKVYEDVTYQNIFWLKEKSETFTELQNEATQNIKWDQFIEENKLEDNIVVVRIKPNSVDVKPWDKITTLNTRNNLIEKQITKIDIKKEYFDLYLWNFLSFWKTITQR